MKKIKYIPIELPDDEVKQKLKVAAYCRVSTKEEQQKFSLKSQIEYYTHLINNNFEWKFAGVFFDYCKSGLRRSGRIGLELMLKKAWKGGIDLIITKSISRFSRNILDSLILIRELKQRKIYMYFEKENINSKDENSELMMDIMCGFAQEESRNMSENIQWGYQRRFENGKILNKYKNFMGYTCKDGELVIIPEEAEIVRKIFELFLDGYTLLQIKEYLEKHNIITATGKDKWSDSVILKMLKNEKYKGDTMLQKTYSKNYLTGERAVNNGQRTRYYVNDSHPAIVSKEIFDRVQEELAKRSRVIHKDDGTTEIGKLRYNGKYLLGNLLVCGECGAAYRRRTERGKVVWRCATRIEKGKDACLYSPTINEELIQEFLAERICDSKEYDEKIIRREVEVIRVYSEHIEVARKNGEILISKIS